MVDWRSDGVLIPSQDSLREDAGLRGGQHLPARGGTAPLPGRRGRCAGRCAERRCRRPPTRCCAATGNGCPRAIRLRSGHSWCRMAEFAYLYFPESGEPASGLPAERSRGCCSPTTAGAASHAPSPPRAATIAAARHRVRRRASGGGSQPDPRSVRHRARTRGRHRARHPLDRHAHHRARAVFSSS